MSRIDDLIEQLCPEGVSYRELKECVSRNIGGGTPSRSRSDYWGGEIPWASVGDITACALTLTKTRHKITQVGLENSSSNLVPTGYVVVAVKIAPGAMRVADHQVAINQDLRGLLLRDCLDPYFLTYYFKTINIVGNGTIVKGITSAALQQIRVPVPPLKVQREIVRILDQFTQLEAELKAELKAELDARRRQYEHYRNEILVVAGSERPATSLGQLGRIVTGRTPKSSESSFWGDDLDFVTPSVACR